ncbi:PHP domain-containing protein [bacterium]|nr:PHP domain-containing protein [bacterium]
MGAVPRQIQACEEYGRQPIFGCELYVQPMQPELKPGEKMTDYTEHMSPEERKKLGKSYHLLALATSQKGYSNLVNLSSAAWTRGFYYKPRVNHELLLRHKEGIIFTSCCYNSEVGQAFDKGGDEAGFAMVEKYIEMFGSDNFYLEIMLLDFSKQKPYNQFIMRAHERYGLPVLVTGDCHYARREDSKMQRLMLMVQTKKTLKEIQEKMDREDTADLFELQDTNLWMKSEEELNEKWASDYSDVIPLEFFEEAKRNTVRVAERCKGVELDRSVKLPYIEDAEQKLLEYISIGYKRRMLPKGDPVYMSRIKEEYDLICSKGFASYFIIQKMMTDEARRVSRELLGYGDGSEAVGPGRGCLEGSTMVYIKGGRAKPLSQIEKGDFVLTRDGTFQKVLNTARYDIKEDLLNISCYYGYNKGVSLTKDHKVFVEKIRRIKNYENWAKSTKRAKRSIETPQGKPEWIRADEVEVGDWVFVPKIKGGEVQPQGVLDLAQYCNGNNLISEENHVLQIWSNPLTGSVREKIRCKRFIDLNSSDFWFIVGLFAGDGWLRSDQSGRAGIAFHSEDNLSSMKVLQDFCESMGINYNIKKHPTKKLNQFNMNNRFVQILFSRLFNRYQYASKTKHVPDAVFGLNDDLKWAFLRGYLASDGCQKDTKIRFGTISEEMANQVRFLLLTLGVPSGLSMCHRTDSRNGSKSVCYIIGVPHVKQLSGKDSKTKWIYHETDEGFLFKVRSVEAVQDVKEVYDIEVENNSNYLTNSFLVHNSAVGALTCYCLGITDVDPIEHDLLFSRFLSPARGGKQMKLRFTIDPVTMTEDLAKEMPFEVPLERKD